MNIIKDSVRTIVDFPKPGILFRDITGILECPEAFEETCRQLAERAAGYEFNKIAVLDSRGFIFGTPLALETRKPLVLMRKPGKLPGELISQSYDLEYGQATISIQSHAIGKDDSVLIVDDLMATGGTAKAAAQLVEKAGGKVAAILCVIELPALKGREFLAGYPVETLIEFEGD